MNVLITGGAGFIGTHLTRHLLQSNATVTVLDNFLDQVHGGARCLAKDVADHVRLIMGDVTDASAMSRALEGTQCVVHLAAETGTGQSMYEVSRYERTNLGGTALLFDLLAKSPRHTVERVVVASSRSIYGEGAYRCEQDGTVYPRPRSRSEKAAGQFDPLCPLCKGICSPVPTPESAPLQPFSFYGLTKQTQEQMILMFGEVLGIPSFAMRYQNVYGPGQSLMNPYTGILAIFSNLAREGKNINVFEDGEESRDFVFVDDVVRSTAACATGGATGCHAVNIGSGERTTVLEVARETNHFYGGRSSIEVTGAFRDGDIRHGSADLGFARSLLNYEPRYGFREGLKLFLKWANESSSSTTRYEASLAEMKSRGMLHGCG